MLARLRVETAVLFGLVVVHASPALPQTVAPAEGQHATPLTLSDAVAYARTHLPAVKAALADKVAAGEDVKVARTAYLPQVNILAQINRSTVNNVTGLLFPQAGLPAISGPVLQETGRSTWNSTIGLSASWRPVDFGVRAARVRAARSAEEVAGDNADLTQLDVQFATVNAFLNLVAAQKLEQAATANLTRLDSFRAAVRGLVANKLRAGADGEQADAAVALAQSSLVAAQANVVAQRAVLARLVGRPVGDVTVDAANLDQLPVSLPTTASVDAHPAVKLEKARTDQQAATLTSIARSASPQLDLVGGVYGRGSGKTSDGRYLGGTSGLDPSVSNWGVGVQFNFALGNLPAIKSQERAQLARVNAQRDRYEQALLDAQERLELAKADLAAAQQIEGLTPTALQAARTSEQQQRIRFQAGLATLVDVTNAEAVLAQAESQDLIARLNIWRAQASLAAAQGDFAPFEQLLRP